MFLFLFFSFAMASDKLDSILIMDLATLQNCFAIQPYSTKEDRNGKVTETVVSADQIQSQCTDKAVELAKQQSHQTSSVMGIAEVVRKNRSPEESLKVFRIAVENDQSLNSCDDSHLFKALKAGLSHPQNFPNKEVSYFSMASQIVRICQKNSRFLTDIKGEVENSDSYLRTNLCTILKELKIQNSCK
jgi:hypothetical protein